MYDEFGINKRRFNRSRLRDAVDFVEDDVNGACNGSYGYDLSVSGMCLEVNHFIPKGKVITVRVRLGQQQIVEAQARVMWVSEIPHSGRFRLGLQFEYFIQGNAENLSEYLHHYLN